MKKEGRYQSVTTQNSYNSFQFNAREFCAEFKEKTLGKNSFHFQSVNYV